MKRVEQLILGCVLFAMAAVFGQTKGASQQPDSQPHVAAGKTRATGSARGEQVFHQNCSRCHNAPEGFPPSISGTIATHMRVRAGLSDPDVKAVLQFLNP